MSTKPETLKQKEGWAILLNSRKWHYFKNVRSLCGNWLFLVSSSYVFVNDGNDDSPDNCKICQKKLAKLKSKEKGDK
jgi:hypothetical protein